MANKYITVVPTNGRDYKSQAAVAADYFENKDFRVSDFFSGQDGRAINKSDAEAAGLIMTIRYDRQTKSVLSNALKQPKS